ncbi:MAG: hypothetical protein Ct9H300mP1_11090 [Planctomycetaceae bacterium]|nr:MAG: hypothetical protein Ct9H300mP1_11090 [Planctomycetaceae bacterium]
MTPGPSPSKRRWPTGPRTSPQGFVEKLWALRRIGEIIDELDLNGTNQELVDELVVCRSLRARDDSLHVFPGRQKNVKPGPARKQHQPGPDEGPNRELSQASGSPGLSSAGSRAACKKPATCPRRFLGVAGFGRQTRVPQPTGQLPGQPPGWFPRPSATSAPKSFFLKGGSGGI